VLSVCRRVLGDSPDVDDAFQATFLVLVRKADSLRRPDLLGNWLYGVAYRIARKARAGAGLRRRHEAQRAAMSNADPIPGAVADDLRPVLDEELHQLPEKYRVALVLCYLEGKTNEEAARLLRWPTGTVKGRLARARVLLRDRLVRRGLGFSAGVLALALAKAAARAETVPGPLADKTVKAALATGRETSARAQPPREPLPRARRPRPGAVLALLLVVALSIFWAVVRVVDAFYPWRDVLDDACRHLKAL
jgi:RNA polymerase sigma factor (sigma-70 family)